jgi:geranylgeranyl pyrophosphate synthase
LETGLEIIFAAYYLRDDIIDDAPLIMGQVNNHISAKHFSLLADILNEIGNIQIAKYCTITGPSLNSFIFEGFLSLNCGQKQGIGSYLINSEQYIDIAYNKNGAMMENTIKMMLPYLPNSDCNVLIEFASSFGVASQIRNDIEDLIKNDEQTLFQDIRTRQVNFVLIEHFCRTGKDIYKEISISDFSDNLYNILFEDICFAIKFLYAFRNNMIKNLNTLQNAQCKEILKDITNSIISFK